MLEEGIARAIERAVRAAEAAGDRLETPKGGERLSTTSRSTASRRAGCRALLRSDRQELGSVRCDGLVVATPAGSTGYNLANGGPVMAWGVAGFRVSFIAPHSLTARALVVAPGDRLTIHNRSHEPLDLRGRPSASAIGPEARSPQLPERGGHDRSAAGLLLLSQAAREVRPARALIRRLWR